MKRFAAICIAAMSVVAVLCAELAGQIQATCTDATPAEPIGKPLPSSCQPRYMSGFGSGESFTIFFEDRADDNQIYYFETTDGMDGFPKSATRTNVRDTHFCVKDWPINIDGKDYAYRAWGALWNTPEHCFYVSKNMKNWKLVSTFTIPSKLPEGVGGGTVYYCFHDVICLNGTYYAWAECNIGYTLVCSSATGTDDWVAFDCVGGLNNLPNVGPLKLSDVGTPTGSFFELGGDRGYGKIMVPGDDSAFYLAINTAAKPSLPAAQLEAAFINPDNWTWHDGTTDYPAPPILEATEQHDLRECWLVPDNGTDWYIIYDADFGTSDGTAFGYAILSAPMPSIEADVDIHPDTLNLSGNSKWVTCYIELPKDFDVKDIDGATVTLDGIAAYIGAESWATAEAGASNILDHDGDGIAERMVKFSASAVRDIVEVGQVTLAVAGELGDGTRFDGAETITVIDPGDKKK